MLVKQANWYLDSGGEPPNQALHHDRGRILVSRDTTPLQRPRRVNCCVRRRTGWLRPMVAERY